MTFSIALLTSSGTPEIVNDSDCSTRTERSRLRASKSASSATSRTKALRSIFTFSKPPVPLSMRDRASNCPINSLMRSPSRAMRSNALAASGPERRRASPSATPCLAKGERNSCEMSPSNRRCASTRDSIRPAMRLKSRPSSPISSRRFSNFSSTRAVSLPSANSRVAPLNSVSGDDKCLASQ